MTEELNLIHIFHKQVRFNRKINLPPMSFSKKIAISTFLIRRHLYRSISNFWKKLNNKPISYNGWNPSNMNEDMYYLYLKLATPYELENNIISEKTLKQIIKEKDGISYD
ncbi:MAG: hypothetical protein ABT940_07060 [Alphaproteobacteria bacterium]